MTVFSNIISNSSRRIKTSAEGLDIAGSVSSPDFFFELPIEISHTRPVQEKQQESVDLDTFEGFDGARILLVEDNKINVLVANKFLKKWNVDVEVAENTQSWKLKSISRYVDRS